MTPGLDDPQTPVAAPGDSDESSAATNVTEDTKWLDDALTDTDPLDPETQAILDKADAILEQENALKTSQPQSPGTGPTALTPDPETEAFVASLRAPPPAPVETETMAKTTEPLLKPSLQPPENYLAKLQDQINELEFNLRVLGAVSQKFNKTGTLTSDEMQAAREATAALYPALASRLQEITDPVQLMGFLTGLDAKDKEKELAQLKEKQFAAQKTQAQPENTAGPSAEANLAATRQQILAQEPNLENISAYLQTIDDGDQEVMRQYLALRAQLAVPIKDPDLRNAVRYNLEQKRGLLSREGQDFLGWLLKHEVKAGIPDLWRQELRRILNSPVESATVPTASAQPATAALEPELVAATESETAGKMVEFAETPEPVAAPVQPAATSEAAVVAAPEAEPAPKPAAAAPLKPSKTPGTEPEALTEGRVQAENDYQLLPPPDQEEVKKHLRLLAGIGIMIQNLPKEKRAAANKDYKAKCRTIARQLSQPAQEFLKTHKSVLLKNIDQRAAFLKQLKESAFDAAEIYEFLKTDSILPPEPEPAPEPEPEPEPEPAPSETKFDINTKDEVLREAVARGESRWGKWLDRWEVTKSFLTSSAEALHSATVLAQKRRLDTHAKALKALNDKKVKALEAALATAKKEGAAKAEASRQSAAERARAAEDLDRRSNIPKRMRELLNQ